MVIEPSQFPGSRSLSFNIGGSDVRVQVYRDGFTEVHRVKDGIPLNDGSTFYRHQSDGAQHTWYVRAAANDPNGVDPLVWGIGVF